MGLLGEHKIRGPFGTLLLHTLVPYHCSIHSNGLA